MMKFALFLGCKIPYFLTDYGKQTKAVLKALGIKAVELDFNCCGYPNRELHFESFILSSARNMALAEKKDLSIVTPCKCCFGSLKHADYYLQNDSVLKEFVNGELAKEGLLYTGRKRVYHLLTILTEEAVLTKIKEAVIFPQGDLKVAAHYGCHALRPSEIMNFDNPFSPTIFETLIAATGAKIVDWPRRLDCCGRPLSDRNEAISRSIMNGKLKDAMDSGADCVCTACTYCQLQFDEKKQRMKNDSSPPSSLLITELLCKSMGLKTKLNF